MEREIKFRGKSIDGGDWVFGLITQYQGKLLITNEVIEHPSYQDPAGTWIYNEKEVHPESVGQYTGLKDKNGKEVYEGDVISSDQWNPKNYKVIFETGEFCFVSIKGVESPYTNDIRYVKDFEVIGNIYENPELLSEDAQM